MLKTAGTIIILLSWLVAYLLDKEYKVKLNPASWYMWGSTSMGIGLLFILLS